MELVIKRREVALYAALDLLVGAENSRMMIVNEGAHRGLPRLRPLGGDLGSVAGEIQADVCLEGPTQKLRNPLPVRVIKMARLLRLGRFKEQAEEGTRSACTAMIARRRVIDARRRLSAKASARTDSLLASATIWRKAPRPRGLPLRPDRRRSWILRSYVSFQKHTRRQSGPTRCATRLPREPRRRRRVQALGVTACVTRYRRCYARCGRHPHLSRAPLTRARGGVSFPVKQTVSRGAPERSFEAWFDSGESARR